MASVRPNPPKKAAGKCPVCGEASEQDYRPFCSRRCADVDLSRWLGGVYAIPGRLDADEDGEDSAAAAGRATASPEARQEQEDAKRSRKDRPRHRS